jgi:putative transposase
MEEGLSSAAQACRALGLARSSFYLVSRKRPSNLKLNRQIVELSEKHPRYGYRRIRALLRAQGRKVNLKRVQRVRREAGLQVRKRQRRTRRLGPTNGQRLRAERRNEVWSWDLIHDQTEQGRTLRILTLIDEYTKQALAIHVSYSIRAVDAITVLEAAINRYGAPKHVRSDNGPEFIAKAIQDWLQQTAIKTLYIQPGSPWEQAFIESFHDKLRDECLNRELFPSLAEARLILEQWRVEYNHQRPHSALGYLTPEQFSAQQPPTGCDRPNGRQKMEGALGFDQSSASVRDLSPIASSPDRSPCSDVTNPYRAFSQLDRSRAIRISLDALAQSPFNPNKNRKRNAELYFRPVHLSGSRQGYALFKIEPHTQSDEEFYEKEGLAQHDPLPERLRRVAESQGQKAGSTAAPTPGEHLSTGV